MTISTLSGARKSCRCHSCKQEKIYFGMLIKIRIIFTVMQTRLGYDWRAVCLFYLFMNLSFHQENLIKNLLSKTVMVKKWQQHSKQFGHRQQQYLQILQLMLLLQIRKMKIEKEVKNNQLNPLTGAVCNALCDNVSNENAFSFQKFCIYTCNILKLVFFLFLWTNAHMHVYIYAIDIDNSRYVDIYMGRRWS